MLTEGERDHTNKKITTATHAALMRRTIKLACPHCKHERRYDAVGFWNFARLRGWDDRLAQIARHFYCDACWRQRQFSYRAVLTVTDDRPDDGRQFDYPPEHLWKKLVSRYRT